MPHTDLPGRIRSLDAYSPGLSIDEIRQKYNLPVVIKMASNENPAWMLTAGATGNSPEEPRMLSVIRNRAILVCARLSPKEHKIDKAKIAIGNGSDEIIDLLMRILLRATQTFHCLF